MSPTLIHGSGLRVRNGIRFGLVRPNMTRDLDSLMVAHFNVIGSVILEFGSDPDLVRSVLDGEGRGTARPIPPERMRVQGDLRGCRSRSSTVGANRTSSVSWLGSMMRPASTWTSSSRFRIMKVDIAFPSTLCLMKLVMLLATTFWQNMVLANNIAHAYICWQWFGRVEQQGGCSKLHPSS
ncbi:unnamed protein product [Musa acuminata var. zebrina]